MGPVSTLNSPDRAMPSKSFSSAEGEWEATLVKLARTILGTSLACFVIAVALPLYYYIHDDPEASLTQPIIGMLAMSVGIALLILSVRMLVAVQPAVDPYEERRMRATATT